MTKVNVPPVLRPLEIKGRRAGRECGSCQLCCELHMMLPKDFREDDPEDKRLIPPGSKGSLPGGKCKHQCRDGCDLHGKEERPEACVKFECLWLKDWAMSSLMTSKYRPDRCGVILMHLDGSKDGLIIAMSRNDKECKDPKAVELVHRLQYAGFRAVPSLGGYNIVLMPRDMLATAVKPMDEEAVQKLAGPVQQPKTESN